MLEGFNLLISSARGNESEANEEIRYLMGELGDRGTQTGFTPVSGLTVAKTKLDAFRAVSRLRPLLREKPWEFRYVLKIKPVRTIVPSRVEDIGAAAVAQAASIKESETFRVSLEKRRSDISSKEVIDAVASRLSRKVDLKNPGKIVLVEVIGQVAGVSVITPNGILGVEREKRKL